MSGEIREKIAERQEALRQVTADLRVYYPKTALVFGSMARYLADGGGRELPNDIDVLVVSNSRPLSVEAKAYGCAVELHFFKEYQMIAIAKSLRYDSKPVALSRLYGKNLIKGHARDVIAACLLLGPAYREFGIEQIEVDARTDPRDYSIHQVLSGQEWWCSLTAYARERRGPIKRFSDKIVHNFEFQS